MDEHTMLMQKTYFVKHCGTVLSKKKIHVKKEKVNTVQTMVVSHGDDTEWETSSLNGKGTTTGTLSPCTPTLKCWLH